MKPFPSTYHSLCRKIKKNNTVGMDDELINDDDLLSTILLLLKHNPEKRIIIITTFAAGTQESIHQRYVIALSLNVYQGTMQGAKLLGIKNVKNIIAVSSCKGVLASRWSL